MKKTSEQHPAKLLLAKNPSLEQLEAAARNCKACDLWERATQTVFGEGKAGSKIMLVGEVPGDKEDIAGRPFVGPAGKLLDAALAEAGIDRGDVYVTNAVKHFNWEARGKRRIHKKPSAAEMTACRPWLEAEIAVVKPRIVVCLGATAAQSLFGRDFRVTQQRGELLKSELAPAAMATVHPSAILRIPDENAKRDEMKRFVEDLKKIRKHLNKIGK